MGCEARVAGCVQMKLRLSTTAVVVLAACAAFAPNALGASAPLPAKWPFHTLELGARDPEGGAAALRSRGSLGFRYHYLSGGVNTGGGWTGWAHGGGSFASEF